MPLYEYICEECEHPFEALVFTGDDKATCPKCESRRVAKQLSLPAAPPTACDTSLPPCGPACCRLPGGSHN